MGSDTIAQCNVHRLKKREGGKGLALETFQSDIQKALDKRFGRFATAREFDRGDGYHVLHVTARGVVEEIPVQWVYYHLTSPSGECASYVYTMEMSAAEKFATAEQAMVDSLQLLAIAPPKPSEGIHPAAQPSKEQANGQPNGCKSKGWRSPLGRR